MKNNILIPYLSVTLAMIFWSYTFIWYKVVYEFYNPVTVVFFRLIISSIFLFALMYPLKRLQKIQKQDIKYFILVAFFNPFLYFLGESYGIKHVSTTIAAVMIATSFLSIIPLFILLDIDNFDMVECQAICCLNSDLMGVNKKKPESVIKLFGLVDHFIINDRKDLYHLRDCLQYIISQVLLVRLVEHQHRLRCH